MRMTKRKQTIIEWLSCDNMDTIAQRHFEHGSYGIGAMSVAVYGVYDVTQSQLRSLYATLASMVQHGLLVCTYRTEESNRACYRVTNWHITDRLERDAQIMVQLDLMSKDRQAKAWQNFKF